MGIDDVLELVTHPAVMPLWVTWISRRSQPDAVSDAYDQLKAQLDRIEAQMQARRSGRPRQGVTETRRDIPASGAAPSLATVRDQVVAVAGSLKEALRFARQDGMDHPEVRQRIADARQWLDALPALERFDLAPERLAALPPAERQAWEAVLPTLRKLRQAGLNRLTTVDGLEETAALAGTLGTQLQTATVALGVTAPGTLPPPAPTPPTEAERSPYSRYAPEMSVETGCVECGRAHLAGIDAVLQKAAEEAATKGATHPDVQARLAFAQEELAALVRYDWTPEKIAKNPPAEQQVLQTFRPQVEQLWAQARSAATVDQIRAVADQARTMRQAYETALAAPPAPPAPPATTFTSLAHPDDQPAPSDSPKVRVDRVWQLHQPTAAHIAAETRPLNTAEAYDNLVAALEACGVPVRVRALPATPDYILEGQYDTRHHNILLTPAVLSKDSYAVQTLIHEGGHALLHNRQCLPNPPPVGQTDRQERQAEDVVIATMIRSGLPIETREGTLVTPGSREVDWAAIEAQWGPHDARNIRWASDWLLQALTEPTRLPVCETCPVPQEVS